MAFLNKLMIHLNKATTVALNGSYNTLDEKLFAFLCKMLKADESGKMECEEIQNINEDVVYFVLNGTDIRNNERAFVAGMNWAKLDDRVKKRTLFENTSLAGSKPESETGNRTLLYSTKKEDLRTKTEDAQFINQCWNLVWEDYLRLTKKEEDKNKRFTLNHWLLNYTKHPLNIGVYWGTKMKASEIDGGYFHLPPDSLRPLGALDVKKEKFNSLQLPENFTKRISYDSQLNQIETHMSEMDQDNNDYNNVNNIGFAVYHIIRSYGCWGGNSFYSIPINYGSAKEKRIGVLSICSKKPLNEKMVERWSLVANKIFKDIILEELDTYKENERKLNLTHLTYSLGHNLKNRVLDGDTKISQLKEQVKNLIKDSGSSSSVKKELGKVINELSDVALQVKSLSNVGNLLDLIARSMTEEHPNVFALKNDWHSKDETKLNDFLVTFYKKKFCVVSKLGIYGMINLENLPEGIKIMPWLTNPETGLKIRPADFIYEEIFFELFVNALSYGNTFIEDEKNFVQIDISTDGNKIIVANIPGKSLNENTKFAGHEDGKELAADLIAHGGLLYISEFLSVTNTGSLKICLDKKENKFKVILSFEGLIN